jgi:hypothetical protein
MSEQTLKRRITELEEELAAVKKERDEANAYFQAACQIAEKQTRSLRKLRAREAEAKTSKSLGAAIEKAFRDAQRTGIQPQGAGTWTPGTDN